MADELEKVDILRKRLQASYEECREALEAADGDLLGALAWIERSRREKGHTLTGVISQIVAQTQQVGQGGILDRVRIRLADQVLADLPAALAGAGAAAVAVLAVLLKQVSVEAHIRPVPESEREEGIHETEQPGQYSESAGGGNRVSTP